MRRDMKRIIEGVTYDTDTATEVCGGSNQPCSDAWWAMYQTRHGAFFKVTCDHDGETLTFAPLSDAQAQELLERHANHLVEQYFGPFPEYGSAEKRLTLRMPISLARRVEATAAARGQTANQYMMRSLAWATQHMTTLDQCATYLTGLSLSNEEYSASQVDAAVDAYLIGFGAETATRRKELAQVFSERAPVSELSDRMLKRILREDLDDTSD
jgi:hypothetical protein